MIYLTYNDQPSGIYFSQVTDVCNHVNKTYGCSIRLVAFISIRNFSENKRRIKSHSPSAIILPMVPQLKNWRLNKSILQILFLFIGKHAIWARGVFATNLALAIKRNNSAYAVVFDGRGAYQAEFEEYLNKTVTLKDDVRKLEEIAIKQSDFRLAISGKLVEYWRKNYGYTSDKHVIIPCTINSSIPEEIIADKTNAKKLKKELGYSESDIIFVFSGSSADWHSLDLMDNFIFRQMQKNDSVKLLLLMNVNMETLKVFKFFSKRVFQTWVSPLEVRQYLCIADYGILLREKSITNQVASPTKFAEYLYAGLRVIISREIGDFSKFVNDNKCGIVIDEINDHYEWNAADVTEKSRLTELAVRFFFKEAYNDKYAKIREVLHITS